MIPFIVHCSLFYWYTVLLNSRRKERKGNSRLTTFQLKRHFTISTCTDLTALVYTFFCLVDATPPPSGRCSCPLLLVTATPSPGDNHTLFW